MQRLPKFTRSLAAFTLASVSLLAQANVIMASNDAAALIPDAKAAGVTRTISLGDPGVVEDLTVMLAMDHAELGELVVTLSHGDTTIDLFRRVRDADSTVEAPLFSTSALSSAYPITFSGSAMRSAVNMGKLCEDDAVIGSATCKSTLFKPKQSFDLFDGDLVAGDWTLKVSDLTKFHTGNLLWWSLTAEVGAVLTPEELPTLAPVDQGAAQAVPEPGSLAMVGLALLGLGLSQRLQRRRG